MATDSDTLEFLSLLQHKVQSQIQAMRDSGKKYKSCVFRGETQAVDQSGNPRHVTSQLYRWLQCENSRLKQSDSDGKEIAELSTQEKIQLAMFQEKIINRMQGMLPAPQSEEEPWKLLARMQHFGYKTNLIDFTRDYLIALFFACYDQNHRSDGSSALSDGRIIILPEDERMVEARIGDIRTVAQRSVLCWEPQGVIPKWQYETLVVPADLKNPLMLYLVKNHYIWPKTVFPDFAGAAQYVSSDFVLGNIWNEMSQE